MDEKAKNAVRPIKRVQMALKPAPSILDSVLHRCAQVSQSCCRSLLATFVALQTLSGGSAGGTRLLSMDTEGLQANRVRL